MTGIFYFVVFLAFSTAYPAAPADLTDDLLLFGEDFEQGLGRSRWRSKGDVSVITADHECIDPEFRAWFGNDTHFARLGRGNGGGAELELRLSVSRDAFLSINFKTDIDGSYARFHVYIDGVLHESFSGLDHVWQNWGAALPQGDHAVRLVLTSESRYIKNHDNAVYVDNITIAADIVHHITVDPPGMKDVFVGGPALQFYPRARRIDGSVIPFNTEDFSMDATDPAGTNYADAVITGDGFFIPIIPGTYRIMAALKDSPELYGLSGEITVHDENYMREPYSYSGKIYRGYSGGSGPAGPFAHKSITVNYPAEKEFSADGFFTLQGKIHNPQCMDNALLVVSYTGGTENNAPADRYYIRGAFSTRVWLRYGPGEYTVNLFHLLRITAAGKFGADGFIASSVMEGKPGVTFTVRNTRIEYGRYIYPDSDVQSDDFTIVNLSREIIHGIHDEKEKIRAVHDYVVRLLMYDKVSAYGSTKANQDALTAFRRKTAVCTGYANLSAALLRAAGIPAEVIFRKDLDHVYNHVYVNGNPYLMDCTHDDPLPRDTDEWAVNYAHFLKEAVNE
jgi:hypothetical protein